MCKRDKKTISVCLLYCEFSSKVWFASPLTIRSNVEPNIPFFNWLKKWFDLDSLGIDNKHGVINAIAITYWNIWKGWNTKAFDNVDFNIANVLMSSCNLIQEIDRDFGFGGEELLRADISFWTPPQVGAVKINFDVAFKVDTSMTGFSVLIWDNSGSIK